MKKALCLSIILVAAAVLTGGGARAAEEQPVSSRVVAAGLFKNGLAAVRREVNLPGPGTFLIEDAPDPVHGTWWVESDSDVEARTALREVRRPLRPGETPDLQRALAGKKVTIHFRDGQIPAATGTVEALPLPQESDTWSRAYAPPAEYGSYGWRSWYGSGSGAFPPPAGAAPDAPSARFLVLRSESGWTWVDMGMVAYLRSEGAAEPVRHRRPVLLLSLPAGARAATVTLTYLTKGLAWAPSYKVEVSDPRTLVLTQGAVVRNEFGDLGETRIDLITGFPNVPFAHVGSPFHLRTSWAAFFQQLNQRLAPTRTAAGQVLSQQAVTSNEPGDTGRDLSATPAGEGVDLHYQPIGKRTLKEGEALSLNVASARAPYERIVEWRVPDTRDEWGRAVDRSNDPWFRNQDPEHSDADPWDTLRFRNPLGFPMTTAPATVVAGGRFHGQGLVRYASVGEETTVRVNKALSIRTRAVETEAEGESGRDLVRWGGRNFRKVTVSGELTVNNHRSGKITLLLRRQLTGDLVSADGDPKKILREEGVYSVNTRRELIWELSLKPGEERMLKYQYRVLVSH